MLDVLIDRQRFRPVCGAYTAEKMYRLPRTCCTHADAEQWREPFSEVPERDETAFGGTRQGPPD